MRNLKIKSREVFLVRTKEQGIIDHVNVGLQGGLCQGVVAVAHVVLPHNVGQCKLLVGVLGPVL